MNNHRTVHTGLGMALVTALICVMGSACMEVGESVNEEAISEANQAFVTLYPPGTKLDCTMSAPSATGRRWGTITIDTDRRTCFRTANTSRLEPAPPTAQHCHSFGRSIGCESILDI